MFGSTNSGFGNFGNANSAPSVSPFGLATTNAQTTSPFGANRPLQQSIFGTSTNNSTGFGVPQNIGFGAAGTNTGFGASNVNNGSGMFSGAASASPFGTTNNTTGSSAFGVNSNMATFGGPSNLGSLFGAQNNKTLVFGATAPAASPFGSNPSASPFGGNAFSSSTRVGVADPNVNDGTGSKPPGRHSEKDSNGVTTNFEAITCLPAFRNFSFEELRLKDYELNRRFPNSQGVNSGVSAFNSGTGTFGSTTAGGTGLGFGSSFGTNSAFGAPKTSSPFGQTTAANLAFGAQSNSGIFGSAPSAGNAFGGSSTGGIGTSSAFGAKPAFGAPQPSTNAFGLTGSTMGSGFGASTNTAFGRPAGQQLQPFGNSSPFGTTITNNAFSAPNNSIPFGGNANSTTNPGGFFGSNNTNLTGSVNTTQSQLSGGFGSTISTGGGGLFGSQNLTSPFGATKPAFGQTGPNSGGIFGTNNTNSSGGLFANNNSSIVPSSGGLFGSKPATGGLFGQNSQPSTNNTSTSGLFGNSSNNTTGGGLFGSKPTSTSGGLFGAQNTTPGAAFGQTSTQGAQNLNTGGLFGFKPTTSGSMFGNVNAANSASSNGGLFGAGNNTASANLTGSLFGNNTQTISNGTTSGGLFGNKPTGGGLFGNAPSTNFGTGGSNSGELFSNNNSAALNFPQQNNSLNTGMLGIAQQHQLQQQTPQIMSTINSQNPYGNNPLFQSISVPLLSQQPSYGRDVVLVKSGKKPVTLGSAGRRRITLFKPLAFSNEQNNVIYLLSTKTLEYEKTLSLFTAETENAIIECDVFFPPAPAAFKKLVLEKSKALKADSFNGVEDIASCEPLKRVDFASKNSDACLDEKMISHEPTIKDPNQLQTLTPLLSGRSNSSNFNLCDKNGYWMKPSISTLKAYDLSKLRSIADFEVGRKHYGSLKFLEPVNLSSFPNLEDIFKIVSFTSRLCIIYPDDDAPMAGEGLNLPAQITLEGCYPLCKSQRIPIVDPHDDVVKQHITNLKTLPVEFVSYEPGSGSWSFIIKTCKTEE